MVDKNPHSEVTAPTGAADTAGASGVAGATGSAGSSSASGSATQKLSAVETGGGVPGDAGVAAGGVSAGGAYSGRKPVGVVGENASDSGSVAGDSVAARRLAHGLSAEATTSKDDGKEHRKQKEANSEERKRKAQRQHKAKIVRNVIIIAVAVIIIGLLVGFWLLRWGLHDDASSIQGKWRVQGTDTIIEVTDEEIVLTDEVAYDYVLDPDAKTLAFTFGALTGNGRYRFSLDHNMLAIDDGEFDAMGTLMADIPWTMEAVGQELVGAPEKSPILEDGEMVLERIE